MATSPFGGAITRVVVDREIINSFKGRAVRTFPIEHGEELWGFVEETTAYITSIERVHSVDADEDGVEMDSLHDPGDKVGGHVQLGTIHSHPSEPYWPSPSDIESATEESAEIVMGICGINFISDSRRSISFGFFLPNGLPVELCIVEKGKLRQ